MKARLMFKGFTLRSTATRVQATSGKATLLSLGGQAYEGKVAQGLPQRDDLF